MLTFRKLSVYGEGSAYRDHVTLPTAEPGVLAAGARLRGLGPAGRHRLDLAAPVAVSLGIMPGAEPGPAELARLLEGRRGLDGAPWPGGRRAVSGIDLTWSAPKTLSIAALLSPDQAEREALLLCHQAAAEDAAREAVRRIAFARRGDGGKHGAEPAEAAWTHLMQLTARPSCDESGGLNAGDPQVHSHFIIYNLVVTAGGHVGSLHTSALHGQVKRLGALYQDRLGHHLQRAGVSLGPRHPRTGGITLAAVPPDLVLLFSRRTKGAEEEARRLATAEDVEFDGLEPRVRARLVKLGALRTRRGDGDDLADVEGWRREAAAFGWQPGLTAWRVRPPAVRELPEADDPTRPIEARIGLWASLCSGLARSVACRAEAMPVRSGRVARAPTFLERAERALTYARRRGDEDLTGWWTPKRDTLLAAETSRTDPDETPAAGQSPAHPRLLADLRILQPAEKGVAAVAPATTPPGAGSAGVEEGPRSPAAESMPRDVTAVRLTEGVPAHQAASHLLTEVASAVGGILFRLRPGADDADVAAAHARLAPLPVEALRRSIQANLLAIESGVSPHERTALRGGLTILRDEIALRLEGQPSAERLARQRVKRWLWEIKHTAEALAQTSLEVSKAMPDTASRVVEAARRSGRPIEQEASRLGAAFRREKGRSSAATEAAETLADQLHQLGEQARSLNRAAIEAGGLTQSERAFLSILRSNTYVAMRWLPPDGAGGIFPVDLVKDQLNPFIHPASPIMDLVVGPPRGKPGPSPEERRKRALEQESRRTQAAIDSGRSPTNSPGNSALQR